MGDNVYRVLMGDNAPFLGMANASYYDRILRGRIVKVHYNIQTESHKELIFNQQSYRSVDVEWLEGKPFTSEQVHIPELVSFLGYGLNYLPSVNDIVMAGFDSNNRPNIICIVARCSSYEHGVRGSSEKEQVKLNAYGDPTVDTSLPKEITPTPIRYIKPGEISLTSLNNNSELYFDKYGTAKIISRIPNLTSTGDETTGIVYTNGQQCGDRLWEISLGQDVIDESPTSSKEPKKSSFGNNIQFQVLGHQNDCKIDFDSAGNIEVNTNRCNIQIEKDGVITATISNGEQIKITSNGIYLGNGTTQQAVWGNKLETLLIELINTFNSHVHTGNLGFPTDSPSATVDMTDILSKTVEVK